jgi:hypothetical protein
VKARALDTDPQHFILADNISGDCTKGHLSWTKVGMTEHHTSMSLPTVWPLAFSALLDTSGGEKHLLRTSQKQTSLWCYPCLSLCSCLPKGLSCHGMKPIAPSQLWLHSDSASGESFLLPSCELKPSWGFIQVCLMLLWRRLVWFWYLAILVFSHLSIPLSARDRDPRVEILCGWQCSSTT